MDKHDQCYMFYYTLPQYPDIIHQYGVTCPQFHFLDNAIYLPRKDRPFEEEFSDIFHELLHWGIFRYGRDAFGDADKEDCDVLSELIAETGSAILCKQLKIIDQTVDAHVAYLNIWKPRLHNKSHLYSVTESAVNIVTKITGKQHYRIDIPAEIRTMFMGK